MAFIFNLHIHHQQRPRWLGGNISASEQEDSRFETPFKRIGFTPNSSGSDVLRLVWLRSTCWLRYRSHLLTKVQNYELRPEIVLVRLQIGT
ncbi:hypothetical protein AVEN_73341-1 [Araneus ventricosus]|uniref:Uncharacterized protein n=1 Tax=Araneus ventricosus TaxID=182803 RepID=A0A4Y2NQ35_ARAVE|nr:hypothetical protein AVEN_73341-1 [Araneus ventricosus]